MMGHANMLSAFIAAIAAWIFGAIYYSALAKPWHGAQGKTLEQCRAENAAKPTLLKYGPFVLCFIAEIVMGWAMYGILFHMSRYTVEAGLFSGAALWIGFVLTTVVVNNAFAGRSAMLSVIDSLHWLGVLLIVGAIVGWFGP